MIFVKFITNAIRRAMSYIKISWDGSSFHLPKSTSGTTFLQPKSICQRSGKIKFHLRGYRYATIFINPVMIRLHLTTIIFIIFPTGIFN